jgi:hypothetical protein
MVIAERSPAKARGRGERWAGSAFGLSIEASRPLAGVVPGRASGSRLASIHFRTVQEVDSDWPRRDASNLVDRRLPDGGPMLTIEQHQRKGYRIWAPRHGAYVVTPDGTRISAGLPRGRGWQWQRLFFAQALPLAAALQGLELFHASAVVLEEGVVALVGASGNGKSSVAAHLIAAGASFLTDDVLALEQAGAGIRAHPGGLLMGVHESELRAMEPEGRARLGRPLGRADKAYFMAEGRPGALPLRGVYFLERRRAQRRNSGRVEFIGGDQSSARSLLAASFLPYLRSPARLMVHLDVCASLAGAVKVFQAQIPSSASAEVTAAAIRAHAASQQGGGGR